MALVFVSIEVDRMMLVYTSLGDAARMGLRYYIVHGDDSSDVVTLTKVQDMVKSFATGVNANDLTINCVPNACPSVPGTQVAVEVTYDYNPLFGFLGSRWGITLTASASGIVVY
jgi:hypothetical protein